MSKELKDGISREAEVASGGGLDGARRVLRMEADALLALERGLDDRVEKAIGILLATGGRVIVTGMGKSGHIARKIAATFASTGTPAQFVHPGEASHGDLGMITAADSVVALSNSGETTELGDIVAHTRRHGIPLIAITRGATSSLAEAADLVLPLPAAPEACSLGLAPTTSTTMMLALGDALAVALLERRGFSSSDFFDLHPGGQLGRMLLKVEEIMHGGDDLPLCREDQSMSEVILEMTAKRLGCVGLVDREGRLAGIITDGDLRRHMRPDLLGEPASSVMSRHPKSIRPKALVAEALREMNEKRITSLVVVDGDRLVGIVHVHDCLHTGTL
jgi:arabinose-5-phosphate isomerase